MSDNLRKIVFQIMSIIYESTNYYSVALPFRGVVCFDLRRLRIKILHAWKSHSPKVFQAKPPIIGFPFSLVLLQRRRIRIHRSSLLNKDRLFDTAVAKYVSASRLDRSGGRLRYVRRFARILFSVK